MADAKKRGRKPRADDVVSIGVDIDAPLWMRVVGTSEALGISRRRIIERALRDYFESRDVRALESIRDILDDYFKR